MTYPLEGHLVDPNDDELDLGICCACGNTEARNILTLALRAPVSGTGWGCVICGIPPDGALAIVCNRCLEYIAHSSRPDAIRYVICGYPASRQRMPISELTQEFHHDQQAHEYAERQFFG